MNHLTQSTHPQPAPSARLRSASDKTTAAAGMMAAAAHNIQDRLHEAEVDGIPFTDDELIQLERGRAHLQCAVRALLLHLNGKLEKLQPNLSTTETQHTN